MTYGSKAFVVHDKKLLLILRDDNPAIPFPNVWMLPGGGVEENESPEEALKRELKEELDIVPKNAVCMGVEKFNDNNAVVRYLVRLKDEEVSKLKLGEGQEMRFFSLDEALSLPSSPYLGNFINRNEEYLRKIIENDERVVPEKLGLTPCGDI